MVMIWADAGGPQEGRYLMACRLWSGLFQFRQRSVIPMFSLHLLPLSYTCKFISAWTSTLIWSSHSCPSPPFLLVCWRLFNNPHTSKELFCWENHRHKKTDLWFANTWICLCHDCPLCSVQYFRPINLCLFLSHQLLTSWFQSYLHLAEEHRGCSVRIILYKGQ